LKGSLYRKRYILLKEEMDGSLDAGLNQIRLKFGSRMKFREVLMLSYSQISSRRMPCVAS